MHGRRSQSHTICTFAKSQRSSKVRGCAGEAGKQSVSTGIKPSGEADWRGGCLIHVLCLYLDEVPTEVSAFVGDAGEQPVLAGVGLPGGSDGRGGRVAHCLRLLPAPQPGPGCHAYGAP